MLATEIASVAGVSDHVWLDVRAGHYAKSEAQQLGYALIA